ncbi:hypothetical protein CsatB_021537 [Cannabis sativa]
MGSVSNNINITSSNSNHDHHIHAVLFPFMAKGHTIPFLHLAHVLLNRHVTVTILTTPANRPFIAQSLSGTPASILELPFPENIPGVPAGVESIDALPSVSFFLIQTIVLSTQLMKPDLERALENIQPPVSFMVSDGFLWWTLDSASKLGFPRLVTYGMSHYSMAVFHSLFFGKKSVLHTHEVKVNNNMETKTTVVPDFPWIKVTRNECDTSVENGEDESIALEFITKTTEATHNSFGIIFNSFYELEPVFVDYWSREAGLKSWPVGPLCLHAISSSKPTKAEGRAVVIHQWLDEKIEKESSSVLYVAFGSQATVSSEQLREIAKGLEDSNVNFLWVLRKSQAEMAEPSEEYKFFEGFENRVKNRGMVVRGWVDQMQILNHKSVKGFLSHCGWNSVIESISSGVPILAWPLAAEQPLNAKMVVEEIKAGLRVESWDGSLNGVVKSEEVSKMVKELMEGEMGKEVRKKAEEVAVMGHKAVEEGGSSWQALESLLKETCNANTKDKKPLVGI